MPNPLFTMQKLINRKESGYQSGTVTGKAGPQRKVRLRSGTTINVLGEGEIGDFVLIQNGKIDVIIRNETQRTAYIK